MNSWTQERRKRQSKLIRTWKPWGKSTGAKTKEGKAESLRMRLNMVLGQGSRLSIENK